MAWEMRKNNMKKEHTVSDLKKAIIKARKAQILWKDIKFSARKKIIRKTSRIILKYSDKIAETISECTGKTLFDALSTEALPCAMAAAYYAKSARRFLKKKRIKAGNLLLSYKRSYLLHEPWGVIGIISPWNYPFGIPFHEVVMGLMAGNAVILKVANIAQKVGELIEKIVFEAGIPKDLFHLINMPGSKAGPAFIESGINKLFFTGSIPVGKELMRLASSKLIPVCLELGGNDAMIVCEDASLNRSVNGALWAGLSNCGQSCGGVERIYVHKKIAESFTSLLKERLTLLRTGKGEAYDIDVGALTTQGQYKKIKQQIKDALKSGAKITAETGTDDPQKLLHPLVIIENAGEDTEIVREETFGPVLVIDTFTTDEEVIKKANSTDYGLTASIWSKHTGKAKKIAARLEAGAVTINDHLMSHGLAETHWGGYKQSGIGRSHGQTGFKEMTQSKVVVNDLLHGFPKNMWWYPHSEKNYQGLKGIAQLLYSGNIFKKLSGFGKMLGLFLKNFKKW
jgi:acyl-CoA reductase-like NAD-dependent aldehyde dehydrogenase